jgi:translation elongation factor EF-Tu-like GTPase
MQVDQASDLVVEMTFLRHEEGGRVQLPGPPFRDYAPHLVVQNLEVRQATIKNGSCIDDYLGVRFISGPEEYEAGQSARFRLQMIYTPLKSYDALQPGVTFTVREGYRIVGFGVVIERIP